MPPTSQAILTCGALAVLGYLLFFHRLTDRDLWSTHEARAAQQGQMILETGDWLLPRLLDGRPDLQKPPLYYGWVAGLGWLQGGVDAWSVRLPASLAATLTCLVVCFGMWQLNRPWAGVAAVLILATMLRFTWLARVGRIDMPLTLAVAMPLTASLVAGHLDHSAWQRRGWCLVGWLGLTLGMLLKGPIAWVLVLVVGASQWGVKRWLLRAPAARPRTRPWWRCWVMGLAITVLPVAVYAAAVEVRTEGAYFREFIVKHTIQRGLGGDEQLDGHDHPAWFYLVRLPIDAAPWSWLLPVLVVLGRRDGFRGDPAARFGLMWFGAMLIFLSFMRYKRPEYLLPAYPGLAVALGCFIEDLKGHARGWRMPSGSALAWLAAGCVACGWLAYVDKILPTLEPNRSLVAFSAAVRQHVPRPGQVLLFRIDSHHLAWLLGRPVERLWEWENLDIWACQPATLFVVMPQEWAERWPAFLEAGHLYPVTSTAELAGGAHEQALVLFSTRPLAHDELGKPSTPRESARAQ